VLIRTNRRDDKPVPSFIPMDKVFAVIIVQDVPACAWRRRDDEGREGR
jgi:hypothetical protein